MLTRLAPAAVLLVAMIASATPRRAYEVSWGTVGDASAEQRALIDQVDRGLRDELQRCDVGPTTDAVVLRPSLEISPRALKLSLVVMRSAERKLLGTISTKASGSSRDAQLRAIFARVCRETSLLGYE